MLVLCSKDPGQISRWQAGLSDYQGHIYVCNAMDRLATPGTCFPGDTVLLDIELAEGQLERVLNLISAHSSLRFVVFSALHQPDEGVSIIAAGARGYANRYMHSELLIQAVRLIESGEIWLGSDLVLHLIQSNSPIRGRLALAPGELTGGDLGKLTVRERETASRIVQGKSNKVIADELGVAERTVKAHLSSIYRKTHTRDRLQLAMLLKDQLRAP